MLDILSDYSVKFKLSLHVLIIAQLAELMAEELWKQKMELFTHIYIYDICVPCCLCPCKLWWLCV